MSVATGDHSPADDLDYDDWQGQFEFVGPGATNASAAKRPASSSAAFSGSTATITSSTDDEDDDLRLNVYVPNGRHPILYDEETFLSLNAHDFEPESIARHNCDDFPDHLNNNIGSHHNNSPFAKRSGQLLNNQNTTPTGRKFVSAKFHAEELNNIKNRLLAEEISSMKSGGLLKPNNANSDFAADLCDDLTEQLEILQRQVSSLADTQHTVDDRTVRTKTEHAVLQARYDMLEEQLRDVEQRADERLADEQKRHRELLARIEREQSLHAENVQMRMRTVEHEAELMRDEAQRLRERCDKQAADLHATEEQLEAQREENAGLRDEIAECRTQVKRYERERRSADELMLELGREVERLRADAGPALPTTSPEAMRLEELHQELEDVRQQKKLLEEQNDELQAIVLNRGVEEGRNLLNCTANSLAQELGQMDHMQDSVDSAAMVSLSQLQAVYQEKEDENQRLKTYIDTILLNIVENYPQLLEVKNLDAKK